MYDDLAAYYHFIFENWDASIARQATTSAARKLDCGGVLLATLRDYDELARERPAFQGPVFYADGGRRRIVHQVWDWAGERDYIMHLYITLETARGGGRRITSVPRFTPRRARWSPRCWKTPVSWPSVGSSLPKAVTISRSLWRAWSLLWDSVSQWLAPEL
jgi:hypothetical protein